MDGSIIRALVALLLALVFWMQARGVRGQPKRKRAFELLSAACLVFAALLGSAVVGLSYSLLTAALLAIAIGLMVAAVLSLLGSFRSGEMRSQADRIAEAAKEYRERRTTNDEQ